jgi:excisionase family DNA binding protein
MTSSEYRFSPLSEGVSGTTRVIQTLESRECALKAGELAKLLGVTRQHIYKMAAGGILPSFRVGAAVRFDPKQIAEWLKMRMPRPVASTPVHKLAV